MDKCKELLSDYSMPTILESCNRATQNFMKETMKMAERKRDSIVDKFMTKIALGKVEDGWMRMVMFNNLHTLNSHARCRLC